MLFHELRAREDMGLLVFPSEVGALRRRAPPLMEGVIHHDAKNSAAGAKKPRGVSSIDSWRDWKVSINVDAEVAP
jgi:hypothetical protein